MTINQAGLDLIKSFEGLRLTTYFDWVGVATIGYGTTAAAGIGISPSHGMVITEGQAEQYLRLALDRFSESIAPLIHVPVTPNEWAACLSLAYNIGPRNFAKSSVLQLLNAGDKAGAAGRFAAWNRAGGKVLPGLTRRRAAEAALFRSAA